MERNGGKEGDCVNGYGKKSKLSRNEERCHGGCDTDRLNLNEQLSDD